MLFTLVLLNMPPFEAQMEVSFIGDKCTKDHFSFSDLSVLCDIGQTRQRFSLPCRERKKWPSSQPDSSTLCGMTQRSKRWTVTRLRSLSLDLSHCTSSLVLFLKENKFWNTEKLRCPVYFCSFSPFVSLSGSHMDSLANNLKS